MKYKGHEFDLFNDKEFGLHIKCTCCKTPVIHSITSIAIDGDIVRQKAIEIAKKFCIPMNFCGYIMSAVVSKRRKNPARNFVLLRNTHDREHSYVGFSNKKNLEFYLSDAFSQNHSFRWDSISIIVSSGKYVDKRDLQVVI